MRNRRKLQPIIFTLTLLVLSLLLNPTGLAQDDDDLFAADLAAAQDHIRRGRLGRAKASLDELLLPPEPGDAPEDGVPPAIIRQARVILARICMRRGKLTQSLNQIRLILKDAPTNPGALMVRGDLYSLQGKYKLARADYATIADRAPLNTESRFKRGLCTWTLGARKEAENNWRNVVNLAERRRLTRGVDLFFLGRSLERIGRLREASERYLEVIKLDPREYRATVALGNLYFRVYGEVAGFPSGAGEFNRILRPDKGDPGYVPALLGLANIYHFNMFLNPGKTRKLLSRIFARDPGQAKALVFRATRFNEDRRFKEARRDLTKALSRNPNQLEALSQLYALEWLQGKTQEATKVAGRIQGLHPGYPGADTALGKLLIRHYRFPEAAPILRRALALDPKHIPALEGLGKALIYSGQGQEAKVFLDRADKLQDGFVNAWRQNSIDLEKRIQTEYRAYTVGKFEFWLHPTDAPVLLHFLPDIYTRAATSFQARYGVSPDYSVRIEVFREFGDFSVRTIGFTGFGALGACFGNMITSVSPAAGEVKGRFCWAATAWHELAHTITLSLSNRRIPRWLTEGISVYEETVYNPDQARHMERDLVDDLYNDAIPQVTKFDSEFRGSRVIYAYYLSGLAVRMLVAENGFAVLTKLCRLYGKGLDTDQVLRQGTGWSAAEFDKKFKVWLARHVKKIKIQPRAYSPKMAQLSATVLSDPGDLIAQLEYAWGSFFQRRSVDAGAALAKVLAKRPKLPSAQLLRGRLAFAGGNRDLALTCFEKAFAAGADDFFARMEMANILQFQQKAVKTLAQLDKAHACWPTCVDQNLSPVLKKAQIYKATKRPERIVEEYERYIEYAGDARTPRISLARIYGEKGDRKRQAELLRQAIHIDPFDSATLENYALACQALGKKERALKILAAALEIDGAKDFSQRKKKWTPEEAAIFRARIRATRAALLLDLGRLVESKREAQRAINESENSPGGRRAQGILEKTKK